MSGMDEGMDKMSKELDEKTMEFGETLKTERWEKVYGIGKLHVHRSDQRRTRTS